MKLNLQKTATACGLFASGLIAGYTASRFTDPLKRDLMSINRLKLSLPHIKIIPTIPEFDTESSLDNLGLDLAMDE